MKKKAIATPTSDLELEHLILKRAEEARDTLIGALQTMTDRPDLCQKVTIALCVVHSIVVRLELSIEERS